MDILKVDSTLVLYDYPLDYSIAENGSYYKDPETAPEQPTYQYCAVTIDKKLPNGVEYEVLEELFIPDEDKDTITKTAKANTKFISEEIINTLVDEALRITNNLNNKTSKSTNLAKSSASKWRPAGTIKVWDNVVGDFVPVEGVKVRARRWFTTHTGIASASGRYSCNGRFRRDANYSIDWERYEFALQDGWLNGATYNGPKKRGDWNLNLNSGKQEYYATIFSAAHFYYYGSRMGLKSPPTNATFKTKMKIAARLERDESSHIHQRRFILSAPIYIKTYGRESQAVFGTTIHELAHAAHWNFDRDAYNNLGAGGYVLQKDGDKRTLET
ncbi:hypothetical protein [Pseudotamlana carrageenivorans]|uniref:Uncharacterized protein n=1 Tax=Pseudotamlana carrageenivorans TaxID=2069432 RepID=A0A2I7SKF0_9FLAO|nr:hypothetical protein [Tamlana carrageenivorans]AUS06388.1 hypothetical protein C1A40_13450 [Tamlana carrageenivorans]